MIAVRTPNELIDLFTSMRTRVFEGVGVKLAADLACGCGAKPVTQEKEKSRDDKR